MKNEVLDKLMEMKKLYEAGILTKEEMEAEKAKVLHPSETTDKQEEPDVEEAEIAPDAQPLPMDNTGRVIFGEPVREQTKEKSNQGNDDSLTKPLLWGALAVVVILVIVLVAANNKSSDNNDSPSYNEEYVDVDSCITDDSSDPVAIEEEGSIDMSNFIEEGSDEDFEINCPWRKEYFHNDFGEELLDQPYIATSFQGSWNLEIAFNNDMGFRFALRDNDGEYKHMYSPVVILFRIANGEIYKIIPDDVRYHCAYIQEQDNMRLIAGILETQHKFDILMSYEMYNEPHKMTWNVDYLGGTSMFSKAVDKFL